MTLALADARMPATKFIVCESVRTREVCCCQCLTSKKNLGQCERPLRSPHRTRCHGDRPPNPTVGSHYNEAYVEIDRLIN